MKNTWGNQSVTYYFAIVPIAPHLGQGHASL